MKSNINRFTAAQLTKQLALDQKPLYKERYNEPDRENLNNHLELFNTRKDFLYVQNIDNIDSKKNNK